MTQRIIFINGMGYNKHPEENGCTGCAFESPNGCVSPEADTDCYQEIYKLAPFFTAPENPAAVRNVYIIGSLRNEAVPLVAKTLRNHGHTVFDDWYSAGPEADDYWQKHEKLKGHTFVEALAGHAAQNVYQFDKRHLDAADTVVMVMPAGKSGHLELGYCAGKGKRTYILMDGEPERFDVMYNFATKVVTSVDELVQELKT
jgi:hypothetical protein